MTTVLLVLALVIVGVSLWLTFKAPKKEESKVISGGFTYSESPVKPETKDAVK
jgi:hypothetical protein